MASKRKRKRSVRLVDENFTYDLTDDDNGFDNNNYVQNLEMLEKESDLKALYMNTFTKDDVVKLELGNSDSNLASLYSSYSEMRRDDVVEDQMLLTVPHKASDKKKINTSIKNNVTEPERSSDSDLASLHSSNSEMSVATTPLHQITELDYTITKNPDFEDGLVANDDPDSYTNWEEENIENPTKRRKVVQDNCRKRRPRTVFNDLQNEFLSAVYQIKEVLGWTERGRISKLLNLSDFNVKTWFKNSRRVSKKDSNWAVLHMDMARSFQNKFNVLPDLNVVCKLCETYIDDYEMLETHWAGCVHAKNKNSKAKKNVGIYQRVRNSTSVVSREVQNQPKSFTSDLNKEVVIPPIIHVPKQPPFSLYHQPQVIDMFFNGTRCIFPGFKPPDHNLTLPQPVKTYSDTQEPEKRRKKRRKSTPHKITEKISVAGESIDLTRLSVNDGVQSPNKQVMPCFSEPIEETPDLSRINSNFNCSVRAFNNKDIPVAITETEVIDCDKSSDMLNIPIDISSDEMNDDTMNDEQKLQISKLTKTAVPSTRTQKQLQNSTEMNNLDIYERRNYSNIVACPENSRKSQPENNRKSPSFINKAKEILDNDNKLLYKKSPKQKKRNRITFNDMQISVLSALFETTHWLAVPEIELFAHLLNLSFSNVKVWFKNTRRLSQLQPDFNSKRMEVVAKFYDKFYLFPDLSIKCKHCQRFILYNDTLSDHWYVLCNKKSQEYSPAPVMNIARTILGRKGPPNQIRTPVTKEQNQVFSNELAGKQHHTLYPPVIEIDAPSENSDFSMVNSTTKIIEIKPVELDVLPDNNIINLNTSNEDDLSGIISEEKNFVVSNDVSNIYTREFGRNIDCSLSKPLDLSNQSLDNKHNVFTNAKYNATCNDDYSSKEKAIIEEANDQAMPKIVNVFSINQHTQIDQNDCMTEMKSVASDSSPHKNTKANHSKRNRTTFPKLKTSILSAVFEKNEYPIYSDTLRIAKTLDLTYDTVKLWFKNMRQLYRNDQKGVKRRSLMAVVALEKVNISADLRTFCNKCGNEIDTYSVLEMHWQGSCI